MPADAALRPEKAEPHATFAEFYAAYLQAHRSPWNRALHLFAKIAMMALVAAAIVRREPWWILAVPVAGVVPCWLGHLWLEGNRPTSWTNPAASLLGAIRGVGGIGAGGRRTPGGGERVRERRYWSFLADLRMCAGMLGFGSVAPEEAPLVASEEE